MGYKCSLTHERCVALDGFCFGEGCEKYKNSWRFLEDGAILIDDACRYFGIARSAKLEQQKERFLVE